MSSFNYGFWGNANNSNIYLGVIGIILLIIVLVSHLTANTEEKKDEAKAMSKIGVPFGIIAIVISLILFPVNNFLLNTPAVAIERSGKREVNTTAQYQSDTAKEDCRLCGNNPNDLLQFYFGENNVAVIDLNTFEFFRLEINRYDDDHNPIEQKAGHISMLTNRTQSGAIWDFTINSDRGYSDGSVTLKENSKLSLESMAAHLCADCLTAVMNEYTYKGEQWNIAVINFADKKITPLQEAVTGFSFGDFYVKSKYDKTDGKIDLLVWYCPVRY